MKKRLEILGLTTLEERRVRGDLIEIFKIANGIERIEFMNEIFRPSGTSMKLRGNSMKLKRESFQSKLRNDFSAAVSARHVFFSNRLVERWNKLPKNVVKSKSVASFKIALDKFNGIGCYSATLS